MGHIDMKFQKERYSPLYNQNVGINTKTDKLMSKRQFQYTWATQYQKFKNQMEEIKPTVQQVQNAKIFDFLCYKAIVMYTYKINNIQNVQAFDSRQYKNVMKMFFTKSYVKQNSKIQKFLKGLNNFNFDVIFLQQTTKKLIQSLKKLSQFQIYQSRTQKKQSLVVVRRKKFKTFHNVQQFIKSQNKDVQQLLTWNSDMAIAVADHYIFISGHLSSKAQENHDQVLQMNKCIKKLADLYTDNIIVIGCDVNSHYSQAPISYQIYPTSRMKYTNVKRRTSMQAQYQKSDKIVESYVDYIISNSPLKNSKICDLNGQQKNRMNITYIPNQNHPFDHFLVCSSLEMFRVTAKT